MRESITYLMPEGITEGFFKDRGSKFISFLIPVKSSEEVDEELKKIRKTYFDARHVCYAWRIGDPPQEKANDDGEPNYSAGAPMLRRLKSHNLSNSLVAVIRYFGGTKLGVSGLIHAYETAAEEAILLAKTQKIIHLSQATIVFSYQESAQVNKILTKLMASHQVQILSSEYLEQCTFIISFPSIYTDNVLETLENWQQN